MGSLENSNKFQFKDFLDYAREEMDKYLPGENEILDEIAIKICSTFKWVIERNATTSSKEKEIEDFINSEKKIETKYSGMQVKEVLDDLLEQQARISWFFNGCGMNQKEDERKNDYYNAKRYIAFLLADMLLLKCHERKVCPYESFKPEYVEYLQGITIEEFARFKAYLKWHNRNKNNRIKDTNKHLDDFFSVIGFLDRTVINCKNIQCRDSLEYWKRIIESGNCIAKLDIIKRAKINTLRRLFRDEDKKIGYVEQFVTNFYKNVNQLLTPEVTPEEAIKEIVSSMYEKSDLINMFEFILKCFLVSKLSREEHNSIRLKYKKDPLEPLLV